MNAKDRLEKLLNQITFNPNFLANVSLSTEIKNPSDVRTQCIPDGSLPFEISIEVKDKDSAVPGYLSALASFKIADLEHSDMPDTVFYYDILTLIIMMFGHEIQENFLTNDKVYCQPHRHEVFNQRLMFATEHLIRFIEA